MTLDIKNIYPLIVPANYYSKETWDLPHYVLPNQNYIMTWVIFESNISMKYLTQEQQNYLNMNYDNWQQYSFENLRLSFCNECFFSEYKLSEDKKRLIFISFLNKDGIGSSRITFINELTKAFPEGYYLAFPDRSCGLAIAKNITDKELKEVKELVINMHFNATNAMSRELHFSNDFALPTIWTQPIDIQLSQDLANEIISYRPK